MRRMLFGLATASFVVFLAAPVSAADLTIWWNKSYYPEEDQQFDKIVAAFEKQKGIDVEYVYYTNEDVPRKVLAALTAGEPPDLSYGFLFDLQHTSRWAYDDVLEDVSDVVGEIEPNLLPSAMEAVRLLNGKTGKRSIYAMPVAQQIEHIHVWKDLADQAGLDLAGVPKTLERVVGLVVQDGAAGGAQGHRRPAEVRRRPADVELGLRHDLRLHDVPQRLRREARRRAAASCSSTSPRRGRA